MALFREEDMRSFTEGGASFSGEEDVSRLRGEVGDGGVGTDGWRGSTTTS